MSWSNSDPRRNRRRLRMLVIAVVAVAAVLVLVPAALESGTPNGLFAYVVPTTSGPIPACSQDGSCTSANGVSDFIYVANLNRLSQLNGFTTRATVPNAFVVSRVDETIDVNGVHQPQFDTTFTPPPDSSPVPAWSGRWPATVTCQGQPGSFQRPCNVVGNPAIVPGETTAILFTSWGHGSNEPNGLYVFSTRSTAASTAHQSTSRRAHRRSK